MKSIVTVILFSSLLFASCSTPQEVNEKSTMEVETEKDPLLRHVVMFKFKEESTQEDIDSVIDAFRSLPNDIPEINSFEWGVNNSPEGLNQGLTHCFFLTFKSEEARDVYLPHPAHKAFGEILGPHLDKVTVVDYWVKD